MPTVLGISTLRTDGQSDRRTATCDSNTALCIARYERVYTLAGRYEVRNGKRACGTLRYGKMYATIFWLAQNACGACVTLKIAQTPIRCIH